MPVAVLGATGTVGQRFVQLLTDHPWFEVAALAASDRSAGRRYGDTCRWRLETPMPEAAADRVVQRCDARVPGAIVFSALDAEAARDVEPAFAAAGRPVFTNARTFRMDEDVPLLIPEVNPDHLGLLDAQRRRRGWAGCIVANPNCSTAAITLALAPLARAFGLVSVTCTTLQAVSGAGYPGVASLDILANVVPGIPGEEEKIESESVKILGRRDGDAVVRHRAVVSAQTTRVPVLDGHLAALVVRLEREAGPGAVREALAEFRGEPQVRALPSAPARPVVTLDQADRPQPRLDAGTGNGMSVVAGPVRRTADGFKLMVLGHNTIRGAAGAALLNAELYVARGLLGAD